VTRWLYIKLLWMHPRAFRQRFGDEMLGIFDQSEGKGALLMDGVISLLRQRALRRSPALPATVDGAPLFYMGEPEVPRAGALLPGVLITLFAFAAISFTTNHRWTQMNLLVGSHHPSPSHLLPARVDAQPVEDLPAEVKVKPYPAHPPISAYFKLILVLGVLDADEDNVISAEEMQAAPDVLWRLDKNHDGKLSAEECGLRPDPNMDPALLPRLRLMFMRVHPVLAALDTNHDGEISASEIRNAAAALRTLDRNGDGKLVEGELLPDRAVAMVANLMLMLDKNGDGRITPDEKPNGLPLRWVESADRDGKGYVTEEDLANAIRVKR
jgi:Ca2+-binding EF-hand superfamily protein